MTRKFQWISAILFLPIISWIMIAPLLVFFPIYGDEFEWKRTTARLFLDGNKLQYLFPECSRGRLLDSPVSWYPLEYVHAAMYANMTNPQVLRYWGILFFAVLIAYCTWFVRFRLRPEAGVLATASSLLAPLSLGVLPFLLVMNRPEQSLLLVLAIACTLPLVLDKGAPGPVKAWLLALLFALLSWIAVASHIKGVFILPVISLCAWLTIRDWRPTLLVVALACFGAWETFALWTARTDCQESPFLVGVFRGQSLSPSDLQFGLWPFLMRVLHNIEDVKDYWRATGFRHDYQGDWLPTADSARTLVEASLNAFVPILVAIAAIAIVTASLSAISGAVRQRRLPDAAALISACLLATLLAIAGFQTGKNFYESSLAIPMLGLAALLVLPEHFTRITRIALAGLCVVATISQATLAWRFYPHLATWRQAPVTLAAQQQQIRSLVARCGIKIDNSTSHLLLDYPSFTTLWQTRQPYGFGTIEGWWATGLDATHVIQDAQISGAVGTCRPFIGEHWASVVSDGQFCCAH